MWCVVNEHVTRVELDVEWGFFSELAGGNEVSPCQWEKDIREGAMPVWDVCCCQSSCVVKLRECS